MGILSNILDISGFFLIVVINLSLIALLCYYAKKKFESIEEIQKEQSKILFNLVHSASNTATIGQAPSSQIDPMFLSPPIVNVSQVSEENKIINMTSIGPQVINLEMILIMNLNLNLNLNLILNVMMNQELMNLLMKKKN